MINLKGRISGEFNMIPEEGNKVTVNVNESSTFITLTQSDIVELLLATEDSDKILAEFQKKKEEEELVALKEKIKKIKPTGFEYASDQAHSYRKLLEDFRKIEQMEYLQSIVSYNPDGTMNIIPLKKIFCNDISGLNIDLKFSDAQKSAATNGYKLMTDYNDTDTNEEKHKTDFYKVINLFNFCGKDSGDNDESAAVFRDMAGCNNRYRTATPSKDSDGIVMPPVILARSINKFGFDRTGMHIDHYRNFVCGLKDME